METKVAFSRLQSRLPVVIKETKKHFGSLESSLTCEYRHLQVSHFDDCHHALVDLRQRVVHYNDRGTVRRFLASLICAESRMLADAVSSDGVKELSSVK